MPRKGKTGVRGAALTIRDEDQFIYWLERCGEVREACRLAAVSENAMYKRRKRSKRFAARWAAVVDGDHDARVEMFFQLLAKSLVPGTAFRKAGLTGGWFANKMARDVAFQERYAEVLGSGKQELAEELVTAAKAEKGTLLLKVVERLLADILPKGS